MLLRDVSMLKKRLGAEGIERKWYSDEKLINYFKIPSTLIIPESCERVGVYAFYCCQRLKKVVISEGVLWIRSHAFTGCYRLEEVVIPESVDWIGINAFRGCNNSTIILKKPKNDFESIGDQAFEGCMYVKEKVGS